MLLAIKLSDYQVRHSTGGPFGAVVFNLESGAVVGVGVNRVVPDNASIAHAEVVAWSCAQQVLGTYDLGQAGRPPLGLYTSAQPCIACWGGLFWTGLAKLVCGASKNDVEQLAGFHEGPVPADWDRLLEKHCVTVVKNVCRQQACDVLQRYGAGGVIYNPSQA
jgi:tRNA(Arg) A34 adenosine deaminase TadA